MADQIRLNLGAGEIPLPGYVNVDRKTGGEVFPLTAKWPLSDLEEADGRAVPKAGVAPAEGYADGSVDEVRASHVLEHFSHRETLNVLREWARVLRTGGVLKVAVPDFDKIIGYYQSGTDPKSEGYLMGGHVDGDDRHGAIFNDTKLRELLALAGLVRIQPWTSEIGDCASLPVSLNLMGYKPTAMKVEGVAAVLSMPRLAFTDQATCQLEATRKLAIPTFVRQGVFWGQTLTAAIDKAIADADPKYVLAIDYDTVFTPRDVADLYELMESRPDIDALCPMQVGRDRDTLLLTIREDGTRNKSQVLRTDMEAETIRVSTCHFGLTLIRVAALAKCPKPWFHHQPDAAGGWGDGRVDEDIWFWRQWEAAGLTAHQANHVVVGHLQLVATWPDKNLAPIHQYVGDYRKEGKPEGAWA